MAKIVEIKTQNCPRCKLFEPQYQQIQANYPEHTYEVLVFGVDPKAAEYATKYGIKSAPTFVIEQDGKDAIIVKQEELRSTIAGLQ